VRCGEQNTFRRHRRASLPIVTHGSRHILDVLVREGAIRLESGLRYDPDSEVPTVFSHPRGVRSC
jgi:hypothetical protein